MHNAPLFCLLWLLSFAFIFANEPPPTRTTPHSITINGTKIDYVATAGFIPIKNDQNKLQASIFFTSYHKVQDNNTIPKRPVTFCFCGGPGSSSVWLHMGAFGPKRVELPFLKAPMPPFSYTDNPYSLLDITDLVFVDPVSTGYSHTGPDIPAKNYYNTREDTKSLSEFVRIYITQYNLWDSPKFLVGESYGAFRIANMASYMHDQLYIYLNGLIMLSPSLNFEALWDNNDGNDLPYPLMLPSFAAAANYHLNGDKNRDEVLSQAEKYAYTTYSQMLFKGDSLSKEEKNTTAEALSKLVGLPKDFLLLSNLRVDAERFSKNLLSNKNLAIGFCDSRYAQPAINESKPIFGCVDPAGETYLGPFTAAINNYLYNDLNWKSDQEYVVFADACNWDYGGSNQYANAQEKLRGVMTKNPYLRVIATGGYYDLVTPYQTIIYNNSHLFLDPSVQSHLQTKIYPAGHMAYMETPILKQIKEDLANFYKEALKE